MTTAIESIKDGFGIDSIAGPHTVPIIANQADIVLNAQNEIAEADKPLPFPEV